MNMKHKAVLLLAAVALAASACTRIKIGTASTTSFGRKCSIESLTFNPTSGAFTVKGYNSDQVTALGNVAEAAARGAVQGMKGTAP